MLAYILGVVLFVLGICVSVALHEAGHMLSAKAFGMRVRRYFVGFGPTIFSFRRGDTQYGLKAIPLGGFCDIAGMTNMDEVTPEEAPRSMWKYPVWKRTVVLTAGSVTHFILGFIVLLLMAGTMGLPNLADTPEVDRISCAQDATTRDELANKKCGPSDPTPAADAGIRQGDVITAIGDKPVETWAQAQPLLAKQKGNFEITLQRGDSEVRVDVDPVTVKRAQIDQKTSEVVGVKEMPMVGIAPVRWYEYSAGEAPGATVVFTGTMFEKTWEALLKFPQKIPKVVEAIMGEERDPETPVSVVGASRLGGEAVEAGYWELFLLLLASLNFFIGVFNLLPLLPLDGGHIAVTWYEKARDFIRKLRGLDPGGPVDYTKLSAVTMVLVVIGGAVVLLTVTADIVNPIRLGE